ncbi:prolyl tripeptidyl peptidase precursor [bacterium BMS3Abin05]|nr:prolyl tripeptidyl peptidase precursor [bacterium BMS3Abin05]
MKRLLVKFAAAVLAAILWVGMGQSENLTVKYLVGLKYPTQLTLSPGGQFVAFVVREADFENSQYVRNIWRISTKMGKTQKLTFGTNQNRSPRYAPDGKWLAFLSNAEYEEDQAPVSGRTQIWLFPKTGEARRLTRAPKGVQFFRWAPDGKSIAYITRKPLSQAKQAEKKKLEALKFDAEVIGKPKQPNEIWMVQIADQTARKIATIDPGLNYLTFSPDGKTIAYTTNATGEYNDEQKYDIFLLDVKTGRKRQLTNFPGPETNPLFSPDGKTIAYLSQTVPDIEFAQTDVSVIPEKGGAVRNLTASFDYPVGSFFWGPKGKSIIFKGEVRTASNYFRLNLSSGKIDGFLTGGNCLSSLRMTADEKRRVFLSETPAALPEIIFHEGKKDYEISNFSEQLKNFQLGAQKVIRWKSGKWHIEGILVTPVGYSPGQRVPLIVTLHGGPYGRFQNRFRQYYYFQLWANHGYAVLAPNPRGSSGYSDQFGQANRNDLGGGDYRDIMRGVNAVIRMGIADSTQMGVIGGSYGGYLTNWIITQSDRFKAAVSMFGIFSLLTDWSNSIQPSWEKMYFGSYYWQNLNTYIKHSPAFFVKNIRTPVLILHGRQDEMTFISNSKEMYQALHTLGKTVKFVVYPREGHGISGEPNHRIDVFRRALNWFNRYIIR